MKRIAGVTLLDSKPLENIRKILCVTPIVQSIKEYKETCATYRGK